MKVLRAAGYRRMPWKNGGGVTAEIAVFPEAAGLDDFVWRVSMAEVASDGPFSAFPGIDRTLTVLAGDGLRLAIGDAGAVMLTPASEPFPFAADQPAHGVLTGGTVTDLNVMTRRGRVEHRVERLRLTQAATITTGTGTRLLFVAEGIAVVSYGGAQVQLGRYDCLWLDGAHTTASMHTETSCVVLQVTIEAVENARG